MTTQSRLRTALAIVASLFAALILVQIFLAGLGVFDDPRSFATHRGFGYLIGWFTLALVILAIAGRAGRRLIGLSLVTLAQMALQSVLILVRDDYPAVAALHPVNGVVLLGVVIVIAREAPASRRVEAPAATPLREEGAVA